MRTEHTPDFTDAIICLTATAQEKQSEGGDVEAKAMHAAVRALDAYTALVDVVTFAASYMEIMASIHAPGTKAREDAEKAVARVRAALATPKDK